MTKLVVMSDHSWIALKIRSLIFSETEILRKAIGNIRDKICNFEKKYGTSDPESLFGQVDDMEIVEWEGEIETERRLQAKLKRWITHKRTRRLLSTSGSNWARSIISDREDRL